MPALAGVESAKQRRCMLCADGGSNRHDVIFPELEEVYVTGSEEHYFDVSETK